MGMWTLEDEEETGDLGTVRKLAPPSFASASAARTWDMRGTRANATQRESPAEVGRWYEVNKSTHPPCAALCAPLSLRPLRGFQPLEVVVSNPILRLGNQSSGRLDDLPTRRSPDLNPDPSSLEA